MIEKLEKHEELVLSQEVRMKLLAISPATVLGFSKRKNESSPPSPGPTPNPGLSLNTRFQFVPLPIGMSKDQDSVKLIWLPTMAETPGGISAKLLM